MGVRECNENLILLGEFERVLYGISKYHIIDIWIFLYLPRYINCRNGCPQDI